MIKTIPAPNNLIKSNGLPLFGHFDGAPKVIDLKKFDYRNTMGGQANAWQRYFHYKQFQFVSIVTQTHIIGVAIADIRYLSSAFCYVFDIKNNTLEECTWLRPLNLGKQVTASPFEGTSHIANESIRFAIQQQHWQVKLNTKLVNADISLISNKASLPMAMCSPTGYSGWTYTQKHNALQVVGNLEINGVQVELEQAFAGYDFSAGYMRRETSWRWASINAQVNDITLGLNLAAGVNETGSCENVLWVDGSRHLLSPVHFDFSRSNIDQPWKIYSDDDDISLYFTPLNKRSETLNLWLLKSNFRQFIGYFSGSIKDNNGTIHLLDNVLGLTEDHFARW